MVDFRKMISAKSRATYNAAREQIAAFQDLDCAGMAKVLLEARDTLVNSGTLKAETDWSYDEWALHGCVPALSKRLDPSLGIQLREDLMLISTQN